jgi:hypothetical protein
MAAMGDYLEAQVLNHIFRNTAIFTPPANVHVALHTADPTDAGTGAEVSGNAYARQAVSTTGGWTDPGATGGLTDNVAAITFPVATPSGWGTITHCAIRSASTGGNLFFHGALAASKTINAGDRFEFAAGALDISLA